ncbi:MAG: HAD family hydrolase [Rhodothermaceae bacterium]
MIKNYKHVIWDWNGTLIDDTVLCMDLMNYFLRQQNKKEIDLDIYKNIFTFPVYNYYLKAGIEMSEEEFKTLSIDFIEKYEAFKYDCKLFTDVKETLEKINSVNIKQSVLSAYKQDSLLEFLGHYDLLNNFENIVGLDNIYAAGKIENGKKLIKKIGVDPKEIVLIGDTLHDLEVANEIGADCILVSRGHQSRERLINSENRVVDSLKALFN